MFSNIFLNKENLVNNIHYLESQVDGKLCVMVKANAYGHGAKEIVQMLNGYIEYFGVSNQTEAEELRDVTKAHIIVFGACEDYEMCIKNDISFALLSYAQAKDMIKIYKKINIQPKMHLCINTGMNRYGVRDKQEFSKIIKLLKKNDIYLEGVYTHFSSLSTDKDYTERQHYLFNEYQNFIKNDKTLTHIGGGNSLFTGYKADIYRVGLEVYGYGNNNVKPVLSLESQIVDIQKVKKGEHVGYLCSFTAQKDMVVATIPLGYGDGLPRKLSNKLVVELNGEKAHNVGNICMDAFMIDVSEIKCKKGDRVLIMKNAKDLAPIIETSEYEVLTNLTKFRGGKIIK